MKFKSVAAALLAAVTCVSMAACGSGGDTNADGKVEITMWHNSTTGDGKAYWESAAKAFEKENPNVTIKIEAIQNEDMDGKLQTALQDPNSAPDIFMARGGQKLRDVVEAGQAMDLTDKISDTVKNQMATAEATGTIDGKIYSVQQSVLPGGIWYSKDLFEKAGITETPKTWDEFFALGEQAKEDGIALFTYPQPGYFDATMYQMLAQAGGMEFYNKAVNYDANTWTSAEGKQVIDTIAKLASPEYLWSDTVANANADGGFKINQQAVIDNKALFMPNGNWVIGEMANSTPEGFNWGMMAPPKFTADQENYIYTFTEQMWVPAEAPNMELAKEFIKFMYSDEVVDLMLANKVENKETGEKVATPIVSPVLGASDKLEDGVVKDTYTLASSEGYNAVAGTWATTKAIDGFDMKGTVYGAIDALNTGDLTADAYQQQLIDAWTKCLENLQ